MFAIWNYESCVFHGDYQKSKVYAALVLEAPVSDDAQQAEANYAYGISAFRLDQHQEALVSLKWLVNNTTTFMAQKPKYTMAYIHHLQELGYCCQRNSGAFKK